MLFSVRAWMGNLVTIQCVQHARIYSGIQNNSTVAHNSTVTNFFKISDTCSTGLNIHDIVLDQLMLVHV
jgi:hypothetical protein